METPCPRSCQIDIKLAIIVEFNLAEDKPVTNLVRESGMALKGLHKIRYSSLVRSRNLVDCLGGATVLGLFATMPYLYRR
ncbi:hypothetical protein AUF78_04090 [archaeon 13_1_20CM_2_51_12]|nr:MAG: hypothetical protein AUF78_04090 [archaeon 13_1_20CM_2_51_12]